MLAWDISTLLTIIVYDINFKCVLLFFKVDIIITTVQTFWELQEHNKLLQFLITVSYYYGRMQINLEEYNYILKMPTNRSDFTTT